MNRWEVDFLDFENELLLTRKKLNDLIYEYQNSSQNPRSDAIYQDKLHYLEVELQYINNQLQLLKRAQSEGTKASNPAMPISMAQNPVMQNPVTQIPMTQNPVVQNPAVNRRPRNPRKAVNPYPSFSYTNAVRSSAPTTPIKNAHTAQDYEKLFGKNLMGIFASVLIFISLIIFATLILPHLTDAMKMLAMYIASFALLSAGLLLHRKNKNNSFYIAIIGCGTGSLYLSLLLSCLYFKVISDLALYVLILVWAIFVKYLTKIKHYVFTIIGQAGILIASILGTALCVYEADPQGFFVLSIFYFISAIVFSNIGRNYLQSLMRPTANETAESETDESIQINNGNRHDYGHNLYEHNLCTHIFKTLNVIVYTVGFILMTGSVFTGASYMIPSPLIITNILLFIGYLLLEFFFSYKEECSSGLAFQLLSMVNATLIIFLFNSTGLFTESGSFACMYLVAAAALFYVEKKDAEYKTLSQIWCLVMILSGCYGNPFMKEHLCTYLTVIPFLLIGYRKNDNLYLGAGIMCLAGLPVLGWEHSYNGTEHLIMLALAYGIFLYICHKAGQPWFKIAGYPVLCFASLMLVGDISLQFMRNYNTSHRIAIEHISTKSELITFFVLAAIHLVLSRLECFSNEKSVERTMLGINGVLMFAGSIFMNITDEFGWKMSVILLTVLLFFINSRKLLHRHKHMGYYIALKYNTLMLCILNSFDAVNYVVSICLLIFAIISIIAGFYKDMVTFRLYGLILSMIGIVKLIMIDIQYDSTIENAVSFFVSGVLCFVISFIYNRIDNRLRGK